jgi:hypothetical protein
MCRLNMSKPSMTKPRQLFWAMWLLAVAGACPLLAQSGSSSSSSAPPPPPPAAPAAKSADASAPPRPQPCWQQAGIAESVMEAHRNIMAATRAEVSSVCNDPALSQQQRVLKIRQIHQEARGKMASLITPDQEQAMNACRAERSEARNQARASGQAMGGGVGSGGGAGGGGAAAGAGAGAGFGGGRGGGGGFDCASLNQGTARQHASPSVPQQRPQQPTQQPSEDQDPD